MWSYEWLYGAKEQSSVTAAINPNYWRTWQQHVGVLQTEKQTADPHPHPHPGPVAATNRDFSVIEIQILNLKDFFRFLCRRDKWAISRHWTVGRCSCGGCCSGTSAWRSSIDWGLNFHRFIFCVRAKGVEKMGVYIYMMHRQAKWLQNGCSDCFSTWLVNACCSQLWLPCWHLYSIISYEATFIIH